MPWLPSTPGVKPLVGLLSRGEGSPKVISIERQKGMATALAQAVKIEPALLGQLESLCYTHIIGGKEDEADAACLLELLVQKKLDSLRHLSVDILASGWGVGPVCGLLKTLGKGRCPQLQHLSITSDARGAKATFKQAFVQRSKVQGVVPLRQLELSLAHTGEAETPMELLHAPTLGQLKRLKLDATEGQFAVAAYLVHGTAAEGLTHLALRDRDCGTFHGSRVLFSSLAEGTDIGPTLTENCHRVHDQWPDPMHAGRAKQLQSLELVEVVMDEEALDAISESVSQGEVLACLKTLDFERCKVPVAALRRFLGAMATGCPHLNKLRVDSGNEELSLGIKNQKLWLEMASFTKLRHLHKQE